jgi:hypothetical protein
MARISSGVESMVGSFRCASSGECPLPGKCFAQADRPRHHARILAVRADADVGAVALGQHVEARAEIEIDAEPAQLPRLDLALPERERLLARGAHRQVVGKDRGAGAEHHDAPALVIGGHEQTAPECALERIEQRGQRSGALEVAAVEDEAGRPRVAEHAHVGVRERRSAEPDHEPFADEVLDGHAVDSSGKLLTGRDRLAGHKAHPSTSGRS